MDLICSREDLDNGDKVRALQELLRTPLPVGIDGIDARTKVQPIIGDDDLDAAIFHLAQSQGPDADATPLIKEWLVQHMPGLIDQLQLNPMRDQQTNWSQPVSPQASTGKEYGEMPAHPNVNNMTMENIDLDFIRSLAGIK